MQTISISTNDVHEFIACLCCNINAVTQPNILWQMYYYVL